MKQFLWLPGLLTLLLFSCGKPDPNDEIRTARREYKLSLDFTVHGENDSVVYEVKVQNLSGGVTLQELTVLVEAFDENEQVFWSEIRELDVTGLADYASKSVSMEDVIPEASQKLSFFNVRLAPDDESSGFKNYKEFQRIISP